MIVQLEKEAEEDAEIYDNMVCWCTTNDKDKVKSIDDAEAKIEELTALAARLTGEIEDLEEEIKKNQDALAKAKSMREKELAEFAKMESDTL